MPTTYFDIHSQMSCHSSRCQQRTLTYMSIVMQLNVDNVLWLTLLCNQKTTTYFDLHSHATRCQHRTATTDFNNYCLHSIFQKLRFSKSHFSERPKEKYIHVNILHSKCLKSYHKNFENRLTNKHFMPENNFNGAFSIVKMSAREVTIFPEKNLNLLFFI